MIKSNYVILFILSVVLNISLLRHMGKLGDIGSAFIFFGIFGGIIWLEDIRRVRRNERPEKDEG